MNPRLSTVIVCVMILVAGVSYITSSAQEIQQDNTTPAPDSGQSIIEGTTIRVPLEVAAAQQGALAASTMTENFEGTWPSDGWQVVDQGINDAGEYLLGKRNCHPHTGSFGGWSVGGGAQGSALSCSGKYPNNALSWAIYGPVDLSHATNAQLTFYLWGIIETAQDCSKDFLIAASSTDGGYFTDGRSFCGNFTAGSDGKGYTQYTMDLSNRLGQSQVWVGFFFISDSNNTYSGITLDDISLDVIESPSSFSCNAVAEIPTSECDTLVVLYNSTNGANWTNHTNWLTTNQPCSWYGVTCNNNHVILLLLSSNQLNGNIPSQLSNLMNIQVIDLQHNQLNGSIPQELGNLTSLNTLSLADNQLSGSIPSQLGNLVNLRTLVLSYNHLTGNIPSQLGNLTNLQWLWLSDNQLSGSIPSQLGNLSILIDLGLPRNQLSGIIPSQLGNLAYLGGLYLSDNQLSGSIPPQLGNLTNLNALNLFGNRLNGSIPSDLGNLIKLVTFRVDSNQLSGALPTNLVNLVKLVHFRFDNTSLCEPGDITFQAWLKNISDLVGTGVICTAAPTNTFTPTPTPTNIATPVPPTATPINTPSPTEQGTWETDSFLNAQGRWASLALDNADNPHFSYYHEGSGYGNLQYAHKTSNGWTNEVVDGDYEAGWGGTSFALDKSNNPHILYQYQGGDFRPESLKYAYRTPNGWVKETIETEAYINRTSLALDTAGNPHIAYYKIGSAKYAYRTPSGWISENLEFAPSSLALDADGNPHIIGNTPSGMKYAYRTSTGWVSEVIDAAGSGGIALDLDSTGSPHVSYNVVDGPKNDLKYAHRTSTGWVIETVESDTNSHSVGWDSSIAVDTRGFPRISYTRIDLGVVKYARRTENGWNMELVTSFPLNTYSETSLALDKAGYPHMIYYKDSRLVYTYKKGQGVYSISGQVTDSTGNCASEVTITTNTGKSALTGSDGSYTISNLVGGTYTITASKNGCTFTTLPPITVPPNATNQNFIGTLTPVSSLPVVLVHGWNDSFRSWDIYKTFLQDIGLTGHAVDNINTGYGNKIPLSIDENARKLAEYIADTKQKTGAKQVDIVAHSMGGLIARRYIAHYMNNNEPDIHQLIMLGTPNLGSLTAVMNQLAFYLGVRNHPSSAELTPKAVWLFNLNPENSNHHGIPFYVIAGNYQCPITIKYPPYNPIEGLLGFNDIAVSTVSALAIPLDGGWIFPGLTPDCTGDHRGMRDSSSNNGGRDIFNQYVKPLLQGGMPKQSSAQASDAWQTHNTTLQALELMEQIQFTEVQTGTLRPSTQLTFSYSPESTSHLSFMVVGPPDQMRVSLRDPNGQVITPNINHPAIQYTQMDENILPFTSYTISNPLPSTWTTIIEANAQTPTDGIRIAYEVVLNSDVRLNLPAPSNTPQVNRVVTILAQVQVNNSSIPEAALSGLFVSPNSTITNITLYDDGQHNDNAADDGVYGYQFTPLIPGVYSALIRADGVNGNTTFQRVTVWAAQIDGNQVFLPTVLR